MWDGIGGVCYYDLCKWFVLCKLFEMIEVKVYLCVFLIVVRIVLVVVGV